MPLCAWRGWGTAPRFGETVLTVPVTASGLSVARQAISLLRGASEANGVGTVPYSLRGRLGGGRLGGASFESSDEIEPRAP